jgi:hypothetical protein
MNFKNALEQSCFEIARNALGDTVRIEHNKRLEIESALFPEVAAFSGPPAKEIDVIAADLRDHPKVTLLVSCKELAKRAEPAHVQEWSAVVQTMNNYSEGTFYLGMVVSSRGFTRGCEAWATSHNLALIPPIKGVSITYSPDSVLRMFDRNLKALHKRVHLRFGDLRSAPAFYDFVYSLVADFEGHEEAAKERRYYVLPEQWVSSFGEMYSSLEGRFVEDLIATNEGTVLQLSGGILCVFRGSKIEYGSHVRIGSAKIKSSCFKNIRGDPCTLEFVKSVVAKLPITSAADFVDYLEFGVGDRFNLGMHVGGFHVISTESPPSARPL